MDRGVDQGPWLQERVGGACRGWMAVAKKGTLVPKGRPLGPKPLGPRLGLGGGGSKGFGSHGPQGRSKFRNLRRIFDVGADAIAAAIARGGQNGLLRGDMSREATRCNNYQR